MRLWYVPEFHSLRGCFAGFFPIWQIFLLFAQAHTKHYTSPLTPPGAQCLCVHLRSSQTCMAAHGCSRVLQLLRSTLALNHESEQQSAISRRVASSLYMCCFLMQKQHLRQSAFGNLHMVMSNGHRRAPSLALRTNYSFFCERSCCSHSLRHMLIRDAAQTLMPVLTRHKHVMLGWSSSQRHRYTVCTMTTATNRLMHTHASATPAHALFSLPCSLAAHA